MLGKPILALSSLAVAMTADVLSTILARSHGSSEINPIAAILTPGETIAAKLAVFLISAFILFRWAHPRLIPTVAILATLTVLAAVWNLAQ